MVLCLLLSTAAAHTPNTVSLSYPNQTLVVSITHDIGSSDPSKHYVERVTVRVNGEDLLSEDYSSQPTSSSFVYLYNVSASDGDLLEAEAFCSLFGSRKGQITVGEVKEPAAGEANGSPGFGWSMAATALVAGLVFCRRLSLKGE